MYVRPALGLMKYEVSRTDSYTALFLLLLTILNKRKRILFPTLSPQPSKTSILSPELEIIGLLIIWSTS